MLEDRMNSPDRFLSESLFGVRDAVNEIRFNIKENGGQKWNTICAILNRIEDTATYLDGIKDDCRECPF